MSELTQGPGPSTPEGVPNIDEHPSFNEATEATVEVPVEEQGPQPAISIHQTAEHSTTPTRGTAENVVIICLSKVAV